MAKFAVLEAIGTRLELYRQAEGHGETDVVVAESAIVHVEVGVVATPAPPIKS